MRQETSFASSNRRGREGGIEKLYGAAGSQDIKLLRNTIEVIKDVCAVAGATSAAKDISKLVDHFGTYPSLATNPLSSKNAKRSWEFWVTLVQVHYRVDDGNGGFKVRRLQVQQLIKN